MLKRWLASRKGQGMTEYAVMVALVALICAVIFASDGPLADALNTAFAAVSTAVSGAI